MPHALQFISLLFSAEQQHEITILAVLTIAWAFIYFKSVATNPVLGCLPYIEDCEQGCDLSFFPYIFATLKFSSQIGYFLIFLPYRGLNKMSKDGCSRHCVFWVNVHQHLQYGGRNNLNNRAECFWKSACTIVKCTPTTATNIHFHLPRGRNNWYTFI